MNMAVRFSWFISGGIWAVLLLFTSNPFMQCCYAKRSHDLFWCFGKCIYSLIVFQIPNNDLFLYPKNAGEAGNAAVAVILVVIVAMIIITAAVSWICTRIFISFDRPLRHHCGDIETKDVEGGVGNSSKLQRVELPPICPICLEGYKEDGQLKGLPDCGHLFHEMCVDPWLELHPTCPVCRRLSPLPTPTATPLADAAPPREAWNI